MPATGDCPVGLADDLVWTWRWNRNSTIRSHQMQRRIQGAFVAVALLLAILAGGTVWNVAFRTPPPSVAQWPVGLIDRDSVDGKEVARERVLFVADYDVVARNSVSQEGRAFGGVASAVIVINAIREPRAASRDQRSRSQPFLSSPRRRSAVRCKSISPGRR
jgi:cation transport regulator ChaC